VGDRWAATRNSQNLPPYASRTADMNVQEKSDSAVDGGVPKGSA
jgi:hypothetical protein